MREKNKYRKFCPNYDTITLAGVVMKPSDRQKICSQCDGRIPIEAVQCLFCGADTTRLSEPSSTYKHQAIEDSLTALYKPPYSKANVPPSAPQERYETPRQQMEAAVAQAKKEEDAVSMKQTILATVLLSLGSNLLILSLLQLFFSEKGFLTIQWNTSYWYIYTLLSTPLIYLGMKKLGSK